MSILRVAWGLSALALAAILYLHLLPALFAGLLVFLLTRQLAARLPEFVLKSGHARTLAVTLLASLIVGCAGLAATAIVAFFHSDAGNLAALLEKMADIIEGARSQLPAWLAERLPQDPGDLKGWLIGWLREHAAEVQTIGREAVRGMVHVLFGIVIGAILALQDASRSGDRKCGPLAQALLGRCERLAKAFGRILTAQVKISAINTTLTAIYLLIVLPLFGVHLPLAKSLVAVTFFAGLLPVIGNLISNSVIVVVSMAHSVETALGSLIFLVVIHKLEYFLNARIVGGGIGARTWEVLIAMLVMEAAFGLPGMVAAPVFYAYLKDELQAAGMV